MKKSITVKLNILFALFALIALTAVGSVGSVGSVNQTPSIKLASSAPFADGKAVDSVWATADVLTGFITPESLDVALDQTEARFLYDDKFLYASVICHFDAKYEQRLTDARLFRDNNIQLFFSLDKAQGDFRQFAFSEGGLVYVGEFKDGGKLEMPRPDGMQFTVEHRPGCWLANVAIPLADLKLTPRDGLPLAVLVARGNISTYGQQRETSAWAALEVHDFSNAKLWGELHFAAKGAENASRFNAPDNGAKVNYFANPDFNVPDRGWQIVGKGHTIRQETMAMSGEWIYRTVGDSYVFLTGSPTEYLPDTEYTLAITARAYGGKEAVMNLLELTHRFSDGKLKEGTHIADGVVLGTDFHTYYFTFRSYAEGKPFAINVYKIEPKDASDQGIDVAAIRLFKGKTSPLEVRKVARVGRKEIVPGTEVPLAKNIYGEGPKSRRALVFARRYRDLREAAEPFAGLSIAADVLVTLAPDQDTFETDSDPKEVLRRLEANEYDLFVLPDGTPARMGPEMAAKIEAAVKNGAGLYLMCPAPQYALKDALVSVEFKPLAFGHPLLTAIPFSGKDSLELSPFNPADCLVEGRLGKGMVLMETKSYRGDFKIRMRDELYGRVDFPFSDFAEAWHAKAFHYAIGETFTKKPCRVEWRVFSAFGALVASGESVDAVSAIADAKSATSTSGRHIVGLRAFDEVGKTLDWQAVSYVRPGPSIEKLTAIRNSCDGDEPARFVASVKDEGCSVSLDWTLEDFSGRILERGAATAGAEFQVPTRSLYTNMGKLRVYLHENGILRDARRTEIYARDRDRARLFDDFTVGVWGQRGSGSRDAYPLIDRQIEQIGVRHQLLPIYGDDFAFSMQNGMAIGGGFLGRSSWLVAQKTDSSNARTYGPINTEAGRKDLAEVARRTAQAALPYGVTEYTACDEPNLAERFMPDEPDEMAENVSVYRQRMQAKYRTIEEYNRRHQTSHASFDDVGPMRLANARKSNGCAEYVEWRSFNVDRWCEVMKVLTDNGKAVDPNCRMSLFETFGQTAASGNDYWKLLTKSGLGFSNEYTAMVSMGRDAIYNFDEFYRSFRPDMRVWGFTGYGIGKPQIEFTPWWFAAHRYGGFSWFSVFGWGWHLVDSPTLALTRDADDIRLAMADSKIDQGLGKLFLAYDWVPRDVAIYYSHESMLVSTFLGKETLSYVVDATGPLHDYMYSRQGVQYLIEDLLYQHDFVAPEQIVNGRLDNYRILFMPRILSMSDREVMAVKEFVANGGKVVADVLPGDYDELGVKRGRNPFRPDEIEVTGRNFDDLSATQRQAMLGVLKASGSRPVLVSNGIEKLFGREAMRFSDGVNSIYVVLRMPSRSTDSEMQEFRFPDPGYVYDVRAAKLLGRTDRVKAVVPHAQASVWSVLPYEVKGIKAELPEAVKAGTDLEVALAIEAESQCLGTHVFHCEVISPSGECRFHFRRNLLAKGGKASLSFRIATNDPRGTWTLRLTDALTGVTLTRPFIVR